MKIVILTVHYRYPELLEDQFRRVARCAEPTKQSLGVELHYHPVFHEYSSTEVVEAGERLLADSGFPCSCIQLNTRPTTSAEAHGGSLVEAFLRLQHGGEIGEDDLIVIMDHDSHPLHTCLFADLGKRLLSQRSIAGIGIPQWQRGHCYLHPSFLLTKSSLIEEMGLETAFKMQMSVDDPQSYWDVGEGFSTWCERNDRQILPLRVTATRFPWKRWYSDAAKNRSPKHTGEHAEHVHIGNLMHYGLLEERPLLSHVWAATLIDNSILSGVRRWLKKQRPSPAAGQNNRRVLETYLGEPQSSR